MAFERPSEGGIDYSPCRYGGSKLVFRGPRRDTSGGYVTFLGSTETYGKFIATPFPERVAEITGLPTVNLACVNAGVSTFHDDDTVIGMCRRARACVVQVMGADRMSNRHYTVHARRNDRFVSASRTLRELYPNVDFAEVHFTRHLLSTLLSADPGAFRRVVSDLSEDWCARMESLFSRIGAPVILVHLLREGGDGVSSLGPEPLFVTDAMLDRLRPAVRCIVEVPAPAFSGTTSVPGMQFSDVELPVARGLPGPDVHAQVAKALCAPLRELWPAKEKGPAQLSARGPSRQARDQSFSISSGTALNRSATRP